MSAISLMGLTREIYMYGTQFIAINIGYVIGTPISAYVFLPVFFRCRSYQTQFFQFYTNFKIFSHKYV
jgi:sodium-coupled monocarboxylate transporter 8/12